MTKNELVERIYMSYEVTKKDAEALVNAVFEEIGKALAEGEKVTISKFGSFEVRDVKEKDVRNPRTKEQIHVPASKKPAFKPSKTLKALINE